MKKKFLIIIIIISIIILILISKNLLGNNQKIKNEPSHKEHQQIETFIDDALNAINEIKLNTNNKTNYSYTLEEINNIIDKKLITSPYGFEYKKSSCIKNSNNIFYMCLIDENGNGFTLNSEDEINEETFNEKRLKNIDCNCN